MDAGNTYGKTVSGSGVVPGKERLFVIKIGGSIIDHEEDLKSFLRVFAAIKGRKILVHGGGKIATKIGEQLGIHADYVKGRRITDGATIDLVTMVYGGLINKKIVAVLQALGSDAVGLTGADGGTIPAVKRPVRDIDYGFVGDIDPEKIAAGRVSLWLENGLVPVFAPLTHDGQGQMLNTNADTIASTLAVSLSGTYEVRLIYCFDKKGVLRDINSEEDVVHLINKAVYRTLLEKKALADGILPKLENAFDAIDHGVREVLIGRASDLDQNLGNEVAGTLIR